jgi:hypothetical protein
VSANPFTIHGLGGDLNAYAYVSGQALKATDPLVGLDPAQGSSGQPSETPEEIAAKQQAAGDKAAAEQGR